MFSENSENYANFARRLLFLAHFLQKYIHLNITNMKLFKKILVSVCLAAGFFTLAPQAQAGGPFRFGVKAGVAINDLKFNEDVFNSNNRAGFTGGVTVQFVMPLTGIGCDLSAMYTRRSNRISVPAIDDSGLESVESVTTNRDYLELPLNFRWEINLPGVNKLVVPFLTTGPDFSFLLSKKNAEAAWEQHKFDLAWNFGFGVQLMSHVQLAASYGLGITKSASGNESLYGNGFNSKDRFWTVTAAYLF